jgi:F-type H+-transporting ATPase subunit epsilon
MKVNLQLPTYTSKYDGITSLRCGDADGALTILENHADYVTALQTGIIELTGAEDEVTYIGTDEGILVKKGGEVRIISLRGIEGKDMGELWRKFQEDVVRRDENARKVSSILAKLEMDLARNLYMEGP